MIRYFGNCLFLIHITQNYSAESALAASLKRTLWINQIPQLALLEESLLPDTLKEDLLHLTEDPEHTPTHDVPIDISQLKNSCYAQN